MRLFSIPFSYVRAIFAILGSRRLLLLCLVPYLAGLGAFAVLLALGFSYSPDLLRWAGAAESGWVHTLLTGVVSLCNAVLAGLFAFLVMLIMGSFALEGFVATLLRRSGIEVPETGSLRELLPNLVFSLWNTLLWSLTLMLLALAVLLLGLFPPLAILTSVLGIMLIGFNLIDLPLSALELSFKERWRLARRDPFGVFWLGAVYSLLIAIPLGAVLFLPLAYYAAVQLVTAWPSLPASRRT